MRRINFEDEPSTNTPIDADNLNTLQDNIEEEFGKTGDIANLTTPAKDSVVGAINSLTSTIFAENVTLASELSINANSNTSSQVFQLPTHEGYKPIIATTFNLYNGNVNLWYLNLNTTANTITWRCSNVSSSNITGVSVIVTVLWIKEELLNS